MSARCKDFVTELADRLAKLEHENAQLKKALFGTRSERSEAAARQDRRAADAPSRATGDAARASGRPKPKPQL